MTRFFVAGAACVALTACGSLQEGEFVIASGALPDQTVSVPEYTDGTPDGGLDDAGLDDAPSSDGSTTTAVPTTAAPATAAPTTAAPTTAAPTTATPTTVPTTAAPTTAAPTTAPTTAAPSTTAAAEVSASPSAADDTGDGEVAVAGIAQTQDDDEDQGVQELPRTGTNEVMVLIAIGCAMIVGGRSMIDLMNSMARAIQRSRPAAEAPPR